MPVSDTRGRAFEFCITQSIFSELQKLFPEKSFLTSRACAAQINGKKHFDNLSIEQKRSFEKSGKTIAEWLSENKFSDLSGLKFEVQTGPLVSFLPKKAVTKKIDKVQLDRIPDQAGVNGDVTDIRVEFLSDNTVATSNISLKHGHTAVKHPRLTRVPTWISVEKSEEAKNYEKMYKAIWASFFKKGKTLLPEAKKFNELKSVDVTFIEKNLYIPLYKLVKDFLVKNNVDNLQTKHMFEFFVGCFNYIKIIDHSGRIEVRDCSDIPSPTSVKIGYTLKGYLQFSFSNGWILTGRLHTATEWLKESVKFDMQPANLDSVIPPVYLSDSKQRLL